MHCIENKKKKKKKGFNEAVFEALGLAQNETQPPPPPPPPPPPQTQTKWHLHPAKSQISLASTQSYISNRVGIEIA